jgi:hypothetical protein
MVRLGWPGWGLGLLLGISQVAAAQEQVAQPLVELKENYPNPFYPSTTIPFFIHPDLCAKGKKPRVSLKIYNLLVEVVAIPVLPSAQNRKVDNIRLPCGEHEAYWDGRFRDKKREVTPGVYYYQLVVEGQPYTRKMVCQRP